MGKKKVNPRRVPVTQADLKKATDRGVQIAWGMMFTVLRDKFGFGAVRLGRLWREAEKMAEELNDGRISVEDLLQVLKEEAGIELI